MGNLYYKRSPQNNVTLHACERFVERVFGLDKSKLEGREGKVRDLIFEQIKQYTGMTGRAKIRMPDFPEHSAVLDNGIVVTIVNRK